MIPPFTQARNLRIISTPYFLLTVFIKNKVSSIGLHFCKHFTDILKTSLKLKIELLYEVLGSILRFSEEESEQREVY